MDHFGVGFRSFRNGNPRSVNTTEYGLLQQTAELSPTSHKGMKSSDRRKTTHDKSSGPGFINAGEWIFARSPALHNTRQSAFAGAATFGFTGRILVLIFILLLEILVFFLLHVLVFIIVAVL